MFDVAIIGCGVTGAAAAYELSRYDLKVVVIERENDVADGTSKANSAILHAGYDPQPGTLMARLNVEGAHMAAEICERLDVPYNRCGSLVVAFSEEERRHVQMLYSRGVQNHVEGMRILSQDELRAMEPNISAGALCALYAPSAAIVSPWEYTLAMAEVAVRNGVELVLEREVLDIVSAAEGYVIRTTREDYSAKHVLNAAGVHAGSIHSMVAQPSFEVRPARGSYYLLDKCCAETVNHVVFQCPTKAGKGVLVAPTVHGNLLVGPNSEEPADGDDVATTAAGMAEVAEKAAKSVPSLSFRDNIRTFAGVRANTDVDEFIIGEAEGAPGFIDLAGIKSPGLTAAPAIARMAVTLLAQSGLRLDKRTGYADGRRRVRIAELPAEEKRRLLQENPAYGRVICRCETITEGEILDALHTPIPPRTVDGVKRRCNPGMGRCQGGFCGPRVMEILSRELEISPLEILKDKAGTKVLVSETKGGGCR